MSRGRKRVVIILCVVVVLTAFETGREYIFYRMASNRIEGGYWKLQGRTGMPKEEARQIIGEPELSQEGSTEDNWYWDTSNHRGPLLKLFRLGRSYVLNAQFDKEGRLIDVYSKIQ
jgi:hypothetical protein